MEYSGVTAEVIRYMEEAYSCGPEFLWAKTPGNAAFRHPGNKKWFAALLLDLPGKVLGLPDIQRVDVLNLKCDPRIAGALLDGRRYLPGYHMNKEHWISLLLDGSIPLDEICGLIDLSYQLTALKRKAPRQAEL